MPKPYAQLRAQMSPAALAQAQARAAAVLAHATAAALPGGWSLWTYQVVDDSPYRYRAVEIWRCEWPEPRCVNPWSLPPQMNLVDLYWRPVEAGGASHA